MLLYHFSDWPAVAQGFWPPVLSPPGCRPRPRATVRHRPKWAYRDSVPPRGGYFGVWWSRRPCPGSGYAVPRQPAWQDSFVRRTLSIGYLPTPGVNSAWRECAPWSRSARKCLRGPDILPEWAPKSSRRRRRRSRSLVTVPEDSRERCKHTANATAQEGG